MQRLTPAPTKDQLDQQRTTDFLRTVEERFNIYVGSANPTTDTLPSGQWVMYYNTTLAQLRFWANYNGTLKSVLLT